MSPEDVKALLLGGLPECDIQVACNGNHYDVLVVGAVFEGMRAVQRQQKIYGLLQEPIADGRIHAVNMKLFTPEEYA